MTGDAEELGWSAVVVVAPPKGGFWPLIAGVGGPIGFSVGFLAASHIDRPEKIFTDWVLGLLAGVVVVGAVVVPVAVRAHRRRRRARAELQKIAVERRPVDGERLASLVMASLGGMWPGLDISWQRIASLPAFVRDRLPRVWILQDGSLGEEHRRSELRASRATLRRAGAIGSRSVRTLKPRRLSLGAWTAWLLSVGFGGLLTGTRDAEGVRNDEWLQTSISVWLWLGIPTAVLLAGSQLFHGHSVVLERKRLEIRRWSPFRRLRSEVLAPDDVVFLWSPRGSGDRFAPFSADRCVRAALRLDAGGVAWILAPGHRPLGFCGLDTPPTPWRGRIEQGLAKTLGRRPSRTPQRLGDRPDEDPER